MKQYNVVAMPNNHKIERVGIIYDWVITADIGFFDDDYNGKEYVWTTIRNNVRTIYKYNPYDMQLTVDISPINEIISWYYLQTLYSYTAETKEYGWKYTISYEYHKSRAFRFSTETKENKIYYKTDEIVTFKEETNHGKKRR